MVRDSDEWQGIFRQQTDGSAEQIARRILGDIVHWREGSYAADDVQQLASALKAFVKYRNPITGRTPKHIQQGEK